MPRPVPGLCDRCGFRYHLMDLKEEYLLGRPTGLFTCPRCYDESHPQLDTRNVRTDDKQSVDRPRSDKAEDVETRRLYAWNPVGQPATGVAFVNMGRVSVEVT